MTHYCPICGDAAEPLYRTDRLPAEAHRLQPSRAEALTARRAPIDLHRCTSCLHGFNPAFDPQLITYDARYANPLHHARAFSLYARGLAARLASAITLDGPLVELGCGDGWFTDRLCDASERDAIGIDAAIDAPRALGRVRLEALAAEASALPQASLIVARHLLEHLQDPIAWLAPRLAATRPGCAVYLEVPAAEAMWEQAHPWDLLYEHAHHFTVASLAACAWRSGVRVHSAGRSYSGQFAWVEGVVGTGAGMGVGPPPREPVMLDALIAHWQRRLAGVRSALLWGAGTKGIAFLNLIGDASRSIVAVVDANPAKHGSFLPGTGHEITAPEAAGHFRPDLIVLANEVYRDEVASALALAGIGAPLEPLVRTRGLPRP